MIILSTPQQESQEEHATLHAHSGPQHNLLAIQSNSQDDLFLAELDPHEGTSITTHADLQDDVLVPLQPDLQDDASVMQPNLQENSSAKKVLIVDAMAVLQSMKKTMTMLTLSNLQHSFKKHIKEMMTGYDEELEDLIECYNSTLTDILEKHAPLKEKVVRLQPHAPWYNNEIQKAKRERRKWERKYKKKYRQC